MRAPDFFIVGAAKCGTTSLYRYLGLHPEVFMPATKWINYFNVDLPSPANCHSWDRYLDHFADAGHARRVGEASESSLYSRCAAAGIRKACPDADIVIMLRNPVDMLYSLHSQLLFSGVEDIEDFAEAMAAEPDRRKGERLPPVAHHPQRWLLYRQAARFAEQVLRYLDVFGRDRVHIILFDDFKSDTAAVYRDTLRFLGVDTGFQPDFEVHNANAAGTQPPPRPVHASAAGVRAPAGSGGAARDRTASRNRRAAAEAEHDALRATGPRPRLARHAATRVCPGGREARRRRHGDAEPRLPSRRACRPRRAGGGRTPHSRRGLRGSRRLERIKSYIRFTRPFTLLPPLLGVVTGAITAWGSAQNPQLLAGVARSLTPSVIWTVLLGSACAGLLNAASNVVNQYYDIENDRLNKPQRPLVTGAISMPAGFRYSIALYLAAVVPTWLVVVWPAASFADRLAAPPIRHECFFIYLAGMLFTFAYSAPAFGRTKADTFLANLTIAIPRGCLLKVAGWSMVASVASLEPWFIGTIFFLFLLGASSTKDFSDMKGDEAAGCRTLPIRFGVASAARMIAPFFILPWLLMPLGAWIRDPTSPERTILTGNAWLLTGLGLALAAWGTHTVRLILANPQALAESENHPSWTHMYLMMMTAQVGFALAYLI